MNYQLSLDDEAIKHIAFFKKNSPKIYRKCLIFLESIKSTPKAGIGKPERLKHFGEDVVYSREINPKNRMVYFIYEEQLLVVVVSCKGHYGDH